jgi:hypothetical protein
MEDDDYWRLVSRGERVSDIARDIWAAHQDHEQSPEGQLARMKAHPVTGRQPEEALRAYIDRLPKREQEASISDLMSHTQRDGQPRVHESPALVASESQTVGGVSVEEQGSFQASSVAPAPRWERKGPQSQAMIDLAQRNTPAHLKRRCQKCDELLPAGAPKHQKYHKRCEETVRKARYRARLKAKKEQLEMMLGIRPIPNEPDSGETR